jgi:hypothetical protein
MSDLAQVARNHGFRFWGKYSFRKLPYEIKAFDIFKSTKSKRVKSLLEKKEVEKGIRFQIFDFHDFKDFGTKKTTIVYLSSDKFDFPEFIIRPKDMVEKVGGIFLRQAIFEHRPDVTDVYTVKSWDIDHIEYLMNDSVLDIMMEEKRMIIEGRFNHLIFYKKNKMIEANKIMDFFEQCVQISKLMLEDNANDYV